MFSNIKELFMLLTKRQRNKIFLLQLLVIIMSFVEVASVLAVGPFMMVVEDVSVLQGQGILAQLFKMSGFESPSTFLITMGAFVLLILTLATIISSFTMWIICMFSIKIGTDLGNRAFRYYLHQNWLFHAGINTNQLINKISQECDRINAGIILPLLIMNAKLIMAIFLSLTILIYNPLIAISVALIFSVSYFLLYKTVRRRLYRLGFIVSQTQEKRYKIMGEGFGGIKDILLMGRQHTFTDNFSKVSGSWAHAYGQSNAISLLPRYIVELLAFGIIIFLVLYLLSIHQGIFSSMLPLLAVYSLAGFKLLPCFQQIYASLSSVRSTLPAFENMREDLQASVNYDNDDFLIEKYNSQKLQQWFPKHSIRFKDVFFQYPNTNKTTINGINLNIPANKAIGLVGSTGSGKTTTIDLLLGLLLPTSGQITIDDKVLSQENIRIWQNSLGFVSQNIFLADISIRDNIAFGLPSERIDENKIKHAATMAHLDELLKSLPNGLDTQVGERGAQLSGGQCQRIGIARALYNNANVLILDEATSSLDGITEKMIMDAIHDFSGKKTIIIIAHRLATVKHCDLIFLMENGRIIDQGTFNDLSTRNKLFKRMVEHS